MSLVNCFFANIFILNKCVYTNKIKTFFRSLSVDYSFDYRTVYLLIIIDFEIVIILVCAQFLERSSTFLNFM